MKETATLYSAVVVRRIKVLLQNNQGEIALERTWESVKGQDLKFHE